MAWITTDLSIDFSRATASAICKSSSLLALIPVAIITHSVFPAVTAPLVRGIHGSLVQIGRCRLGLVPSFQMRCFCVFQFASFQAFLNQAIGQQELCLRDVTIWEPNALVVRLVGH